MLIQNALGIRHLTDTSLIKTEQIPEIFDQARFFLDFLDKPIKKLPTLRGKTVINLFFESSTRTRTSFEMAGKFLSADVINITASTSSMTKGETLQDTIYNINAMAPDLFVIRHAASGSAKTISDCLPKTLMINGGDGRYAHPTQALLDAFTIQHKIGDIKGKKVVIVGDILHSRVARSNIDILNRLGAKITLVGPPTLVPDEIRSLGVDVSYNLTESIKDAAVIMMLRLQTERMSTGFIPSMQEYSIYFGLNKKKLQYAPKDAIIMHPGPINREIEIASDVADSAQSLILDQVRHGVAMRMTLLYMMLVGPEDKSVS